MLAFSTFLYLKRLQQAFAQPIQPQQAGYIYVWACQPKLQRRLVSNETQGSKVWFDDVKVTHTYSRVTLASDYYAFGDIMREQKSPDDLIYRYTYQGGYSERDLETKWQHFEAREFDPVVGRWTSRDPARQFYSPYVGMGNNPISGVDPDGRWLFTGLFNAAQQLADNVNSFFMNEFNIENAVSIQKVDFEVKYYENLWDRIIGKESVRTETVYQLVANGEWDVSCLTKEQQFVALSFRDALTAPTAIEVAILNPETRVGVYSLGDLKGFTNSSQQILLPSNLPTYDPSKSRFNIASQLLHETLWHVSPGGNSLWSKGVTSSQHYQWIGGPSSSNSHPPGNKNVNSRIPKRKFP
jgi:RHS repeat-associated protein